MTHDELLAKIDKQDHAIVVGGIGSEIEVSRLITFRHAIRAVVELHKPDEPDFPDEWENCVECSGNGYVAMYPCETIKVIEKELA